MEPDVRYLGNTHVFYTNATGNVELVSIKQGNLVVDTTLTTSSGDLNIKPFSGIVDFNGAYINNANIMVSNFYTVRLDSNWVQGPLDHISFASHRTPKGAGITTAYIKNYDTALTPAIPSIPSIEIPLPSSLYNTHATSSTPFGTTIIKIGGSFIQCVYYFNNFKLLLARLDGAPFTNSDAITFGIELTWQIYNV